MSSASSRPLAALAALGALLALVGIAAILLGPTMPSAAQAGGTTITLHGANEVPPVDTDATGSFTGSLGADSLDWSLTASGGSETFTMAHIHHAPLGQNGPIVATLFMDMNGVEEIDLSGVVGVDDLENDFAGDWEGFVAAFAAQNLYVNVHSVDHPAGVLRAQLVPTWATSLSGANEVPANESDATGAFSMAPAGDGFNFSLTTSGGSEAFIMAHIHLGAPGENGPVVVTLFMEAGDDDDIDFLTEVDIAGMFGPGDLEGPLAGDWQGFLEALATGNLYVNVHSTAFPPGEVRGQLAHESNIDLEPPVLPTPTPTQPASPTPTATATVVSPTATPTTVPPTATPTRQAPLPPNTGSGVDAAGPGSASLSALLGVVAVLGGAGLLTLAYRRTR